MFVGYTDTGVKAWDTVSTNTGPIFTLSEHTGNVTTLGLNCTGNGLCTGSADRTIKVNSYNSYFIYFIIVFCLIIIIIIILKLLLLLLLDLGLIYEI